MFYLNPNWTVFGKYTHLPINLVFTRDSTESLVYGMSSRLNHEAAHSVVEYHKRNHGLPIYTVCPRPIQYIVRCPIATTEETQKKFVEFGFAAVITDRPLVN
ncbi:hypothetical protein T265_15608, partial [Opisthorchis viverrini]